MKINFDSELETSVYYLICICSFGFFALMRVLISVAIRRALEDEEEKTKAKPNS